MAEFLHKQSFMAIELEATKGTAETLVDADAGIVLESVSFNPNVGITQQNSHSDHYSQFAAIPGKRPSSMSFSALLRGSAAVDTQPSISDLMQIAGFTETVNALTSVVYTPASNSLKSGTVGLYYPKLDAASGLRYLLKGAVLSSMQWTFTNGQPPVISGEIMGVLDGVTDQTPLSPTFDANPPQAFLGATFTVGGVSAKIGSLTIDFGLSAVEREDPTQAAGILYFLQGAPRRMTVSFDMEVELVATLDPIGEMLAGTESAIALGHGAGAGDVWTIALPKFQPTAVPTGERNGMATFNVTGNCNLDSSGDDEFSITKT